MVKSYLRYEFSNILGSLIDSSSNFIISKNNTCISSVAQYLIITSLSTGETISVIHDESIKSHVKYIAQSNQQELISAGYENGFIAIFSDKILQCQFEAHTAAISIISFSEDDTTLIAGSMDNYISVYDLIGQQFLFKLHAHNNQIVNIGFLQQNQIFSTGKDGLIKVWDLKLKTSTQTLSTQTPEIINSLYIEQHNMLVVIGQLNIVKIYKSFKELVELPQLPRQQFSKVVDMLYDQENELVIFLCSDKRIEIYKIKLEEQCTLKLSQVIQIKYRLKKMQLMSLNKKKVLLTTDGQNQLIKYSYKYQDKKIQLTIESVFTKGHNNPVTLCQLSSNDNYLVTQSLDKILVWNVENSAQIKQIDYTQSTCFTILPKNRYCVVGDNEGNIALIDIVSTEILQTQLSHQAKVTSVHHHAQPQGQQGITIISGGADHHVKFHQLMLNKTTNSLQIKEIHSVYMSDEVNTVMYSPNGEYYLVSTQDMKIKMFYSDSHKLNLEFYGHSLPITTFTLTSDSYLLLSGSVDKTVKIWGTDYGNCRRSIYAHHDTVTHVVAVPETHYFFSVSNDCSVKYWDADTNQLILVFNDSLGKITNITVNSIGDCFFTVSSDQTIRKYNQSKEIVYIQEEENKRSEQSLVEEYANNQLKNNQKQNANTNEVSIEYIQKYLHLKYGDDIMATIDIAEKCNAEQQEFENDPQAKMNSFDNLNGKTITQFVIDELAKIHIKDLQESLKFVHKGYIEKLLIYIRNLLANGIQIELCNSMIHFIVVHHSNLITNSQQMYDIVQQIKIFQKQQILQQMEITNLNRSALKLIIKDKKLASEQFIH